MSADIPAHILAQLDQSHADAEDRLTNVINRCVAEGLGGFGGPERAIGIGLALSDSPPEELLELASHALSRLIDHERETV